LLHAQVNSPYRDWFLQSAHGPVFTHTNCQQGHTSPGATANHCVGADIFRRTRRHFLILKQTVLPRQARDKHRKLLNKSVSSGYFWNMANSSARDYFIEKLVQPLATAPMIDGAKKSFPPAILY